MTHKLIKYSFCCVLSLFLFGGGSAALAQAPAPAKAADFKHLFTPPLAYVAGYAKVAPEIDGDVYGDKVWERALWTESFSDIEGDLKPKPRHNTRAKMLWDKNCLYIAAEMEEPGVWANITKHDEVIFYDNDFEVFIDPDNNTHQYFEIELNALNTVFDLFLSKPYRNNSGALISWDAKGMKSAVKVLGSINDASDQDKGWTVEMAIPFSCISIGNDPVIPKDGSLWRINFSRVEWDTKGTGSKYEKLKDKNGKVLPENNWVWSPQGVINMHLPERWGYLQFSSKEEPGSFVLPYSEQQKQYLWLLYYRQKEYHSKHGRYASNIATLGFPAASFSISGKLNSLNMEAGTRQFNVVISAGKSSWSINDEGLIQAL
ncbi:carbohydrate-binding family 9-like protein [Desertivirga arenae]|uniref:carbohydrate-binding family 9-like protein n=1 Tax=Desertivirga arenae TaxID=2810309 RepID=UPI001A96158D|nr:carbohydrate-binding family 9-like protein [Pedobacter sp. SYSU D00823]